MLPEIWGTVPVPVDLVLDQNLPAEVRYLYMLLLTRCRPRRAGSGHLLTCTMTMTEMAELSGFTARRTLRGCLRHLRRGGWLSVKKRPGNHPSRYYMQAAPGTSPPTVLPISLIQHHTLSPVSKVIYGIIASLCGSVSSVEIKQKELARFAGIGGVNTVRKRIGELSRLGWLEISHQGSSRTYSYAPLDPHLAWRKYKLGRVRARLRRETHKGEALMKEMLSVVIADDRFQDNARPGFLLNPMTRERLEFDRWYTDAGVAFEFNGPQHYRRTRLYSDFDKLRQQQARDLIKAAISYYRGIRLVTVHPDDLTFPRLERLARGIPPSEGAGFGGGGLGSAGTGDAEGGRGSTPGESAPLGGAALRGGGSGGPGMPEAAGSGAGMTGITAGVTLEMSAAGKLVRGGSGRLHIREDAGRFKEDPVVGYLARTARAYIRRASGR